ncbi:hypothetical protein IAU60_006552 [Kwoniella sp. DSM 27419]
MVQATIPRAYLEAYPYPAFALLLPIPPAEAEPGSPDVNPVRSAEDVPFTRSTGSSSAFDIVWSNSKWQALAENASILDCLDMAGARAFGDWISGARENRSRSESLGEPSTAQRGLDHSGHGVGRISGGSGRTPISHDRQLYSPISPTSLSPGVAQGREPPAGFWETGSSYDDPVENVEGSLPNRLKAAGLRIGEANPLGPASLCVNLVHPCNITLEMTKTMLSVATKSTDEPAADEPQSMSHSLAIVTTIPRSTAHVGRSSHANPLNRPRVHTESTGMRDALQGIREMSVQTRVNEDAAGLQVIERDHAMTSPIQVGEADQDGDSAKAMALKQSLILGKDGKMSVQKQRPLEIVRMANKTCKELFDETDWSKTPLGAKETWPQSLTTIVDLVYSYPIPASVWWGPELTFIYNDAYARSIDKHPDTYGASGPVAYVEVWDALGPLAEKVLNGTPSWREDDFYLLRASKAKGSRLYECYHSWLWSPIFQEDGTVGGLWNTTTETTRRVILDRRLGTVRDLGENISVARNMIEFDSAIKSTFDVNHVDIPFFALYHVQSVTALAPLDKERQSLSPDDARPESEMSMVSLLCTTSSGIPNGHPSTPSTLSIRVRSNRRGSGNGPPGSESPVSVASSLSAPSMSPLSLQDLESSVAAQCWPIQKTLETRRLVLVEDCRDLIQGFQIQAWDELPTSAIMVPVANDSDKGIPTAVLVMGLNVRRPFDEDHEAFVMASGIASVRSTEAEMKRLEEIAALDRAKSVLFSNISHEFRTPLTLIGAPLEDVIGQIQDKKQKELLKLAQSNVRRLNRLVSTLLDVSRLEAGKLEASFQAVNLGENTRELAQMFVGVAEKANLSYTVECDTQARDTYVDPELWEKIVLNLISNAVKYTLHGSISVSLSYEDEAAVLQVSDTGVGIPTTDHAKIGERFHRVHTVSRSHEGTGIGLALVKDLVKLHGGTLQMTSITKEESREEKHGSTFRVAIPLGLDHVPATSTQKIGEEHKSRRGGYGDDIIREARLWAANLEGSAASSDDATDTVATSLTSSDRGSRGFDPESLYFKPDDVILLVDDSYETRKYVRSIFSPYCKVAEARDGREALEICAAQAPDLIITDVMMPVMDGFELLTKLKASERLKDIPVIMCTARGGDEAKVEGLMAGVDDYLVKPFSARELIARAHIQLILGRERRDLKRAFDEQTAELRAITEFTPVALFRLDEEGKVTFMSPSWYEMSGLSHDQSVDLWATTIKDEYMPNLEKFFARILAPEGDQIEYLEDFEFKTGVWASVTILRMNMVSPGLKGILGSVIDITERKQHEDAQRLQMVEADERRKEAEEAKRQQELLIDITSHEIRNPISSSMQISYDSWGDGERPVLT